MGEEWGFGFGWLLLIGMFEGYPISFFVNPSMNSCVEFFCE